MGTSTHCPYCALQCGMTISATASIDAAEGGALCLKGWTSADLLTSPARLTTPLVRGPTGLRPATWDEALDHVATGLRRLSDRHGAQALGIMGGGGLTNETGYLLGKFARIALGTPMIDYNGRFCMSSAAAAMNRAFGMDRGLPFPVTDLRDADAIVLVGSNPAETMPPFMRHVAACAESGGLIVADPRVTPTARAAALHLQPAPGTDLALALGVLHAVVEGGRLDRAYVESRTTGFDAVWRVASAWWPERVERVTGVAAADQRQVAERLARAGNAYILTGRGAEQHSKGVDTVSAWIHVALALGLPGRPGSGFGCLTGQANGQGGREHGQKADQLPGYRSIADPLARAHVAAVWGVDPASLPGPGPSAYELLDGLGTPDGVRALLVFGTNPAVSAPNAAHVAERLAATDLLAVADVVLSETAALADVVFPVTQWAEGTGTVTNLEGRVLLRGHAVRPPEGVRTDLDVLHGLATRLGQPGERFPRSPEAVFDELRRASRGGKADYHGVTYARLRAGERLHWPVPEPDHPGTPRVFLDGFAHPDGRARFVPVRHQPPDERADAEYPLFATTGRVLAQYQSGAQTRQVARLMAVAGEMFAEIHPAVAARHGLAEGDPVRVVSRRGGVLAKVRLTPGIRPDTVFLPFHFPGSHRANLVTNPALDPLSRMPEFKVCAVRLERVP
ncbi:molybdopterin oxidoreductase family protein [Spongiactinospora sp. TRM90649]|uniref:molybdopterin oxidoreductase family protein n=1 Tax=Spongiactinospora sp. TRM90649 TaxID=3031114 RepID=UPI0023F8306F|nr:molybdopterin oxidoreductase family protein [Spongiactinospora sp. TRM90649]MDF5753546.1 molybdopterin oxidoreductase family protein [Spongiactinospora sp. TRM90649]